MAPRANQAAEDERDGVLIRGQLYTTDDLTFREQKKVRATMLELADGDEESAALADVMAAVAYVVLNRDGDVPLEEILDMTPGELAGGNGDGGKRPTRPRTGSAGSGRQK